jgi:hypothetical protein
MFRTKGKYSKRQQHYARFSQNLSGKSNPQKITHCKIYKIIIAQFLF